MLLLHLSSYVGFYSDLTRFSQGQLEVLFFQLFVKLFSESGLKIKRTSIGRKLVDAIYRLAIRWSHFESLDIKIFD